MKITFDTQNTEEVIEVALLLQNMKIVLETPTKKAVKQTEKLIEEPKPKKATQSTPKVKKVTEEAPTETKETAISLADLKESAKDAVGRTDREKVKAVISEFADKLANVDEADYGKLYKKLQELA